MKLNKVLLTLSPLAAFANSDEVPSLFFQLFVAAFPMILMGGATLIVVYISRWIFAENHKRHIRALMAIEDRLEEISKKLDSK